MIRTMQNLTLLFFLYSKINTQQVVDIVMDDDSDMSEINNSDSFVSLVYFESDSDSTSGSTGGEESDDDDNGVHCPSSLRQSSSRHVSRRHHIWQAANQQLPLFTFGGMQGPTAKAAANDENDPYDYFKLFFKDRFLETLVI